MFVETTVSGRSARMKLSRPEMRNALSPEMVDGVVASLAELRGRPEVRAVVLEGAGEIFCAGGDLNWIRARQASPEELLAGARKLAGLFHAVASSPLPIIARVQGAALGGGGGLVCACDIVVAAEDAAFAFPEVRLGLIGAVITPFILRRVHPGHARSLLLTGERFTAARAHEIGMVDDVVPAVDLDSAVQRRVAQILEAAPGAVAETKTLLDTIPSVPRDEVLEHTAQLFARRRANPEAIAGMSAFLDRKRPPWAAGK